MQMNITGTATKLAMLAALSCGASGAMAFQLSSSEIKPGARIANEQVFKGFGCDGGNVSPSIAWKNAPKGAKSFALLVHDPDAPTGGAGWWHWVVSNIPANSIGRAQLTGKYGRSK